MPVQNAYETQIDFAFSRLQYADPRHPFHKKSAFDLGDVGAGIMANNLKLGCDCLGSIYYLSAVLVRNLPHTNCM